MALKTKPGNITIENARILFRNFAGEPDKFNAAGNRNFCLVIEDRAVLDAMLEDGWNIKYLRPREEGDEPTAYVQVAVSYRVRPPRVVIIKNRPDGPIRTNLGEDQLMVLDWVEIGNLDIIIEASPWDVNGKTGIKAYLKALYITILEDELERKYANVREVGAGEAPLQITSGRQPVDPDEIVIEADEKAPWED